MSINKEDQKKVTPKIEEAMRYWSNNIQQMLNFEFGKDNIGHIIIIFPFGKETKLSWISNARKQAIPALLRHLADHIERPDSRIIMPN